MGIGSARPITFDEACRAFIHRFTMDHVPAWSVRLKSPSGQYYAPHYSSDREWYDNTVFDGESGMASRNFCYSTGQTFPLGRFLDTPYTGK